MPHLYIFLGCCSFKSSSKVTEPQFIGFVSAYMGLGLGHVSSLTLKKVKGSSKSVRTFIFC